MCCGLRGLLLLAFVSMPSVTERAVGADAVFSNDGKHIYIIDYGQLGGDAPTIKNIDLQTGTVTRIALGALGDLTLGFSISRSDTDELLCVTANALWALRPSDADLAKKICGAPLPVEFGDVALDPTTHHIVLSTQGGTNAPALFLLKDRASTPAAVAMRRVTEIRAPVFDANGDFFFSYHGDIWQGEIEPYGSDNQEWPFSLSAYRYAPLATLETENGTSAQAGVSHIALTRNLIYVHIYRLGGSGFGWLAQLPRLPTKREGARRLSIRFQLDDRLAVYRQLLASTKILGKQDKYASGLCTSPDGTRVHYTLGGKEWLVVNGKPQELQLQQH
jgi:hypothetical protein